jgi:hypothetical protein
MKLAEAPLNSLIKRNTSGILLALILTAIGATPGLAAPPAQALPEGLDVAKLFIDDMSIPNAILPAGISTGWAKKPRVGSGNLIPKGWTHSTMWGQIYLGKDGSPAKNVRVQVRDCALWVLSKKTGTWNQLQYSVTPEGGAYAENFKDDAHIPADMRKEADGSLSVKLIKGYNFHFWPIGGRAKVEPADIAGMASVFFARLVVDAADQPDDRDNAVLLGSCGGDYWRNLDAQWKADWSSNNDWAIGRFKRITPEWQVFTGCTFGDAIVHTNYTHEAKLERADDFAPVLSAATIRATPPPLLGLGKTP